MRTEYSGSDQLSFNALAHQLMSKTQWAAARSLLERAIREMPVDWRPVRDDSELPFTLICAFWDPAEILAYANSKKAEGYLVKWIAESYSRAWCQLAIIAVEEGSLQSALSCIESGLTLEPDHPELWNEKGYVLSRQGQYADALLSYERGATVRDWAPASQIARALRGKGSMLIELKRLDEAEAAIRRSLALDPESKVGRNELEYIRAQELRAKLAESGDLPAFDFELNESTGRWIGGKAVRIICESKQVAMALIGTERVILVGDEVAEKLAGKIGVGFIHARELAKQAVEGMFGTSEAGS